MSKNIAFGSILRKSVQKYTYFSNLQNFSVKNALFPKNIFLVGVLEGRLRGVGVG